MYSVSTEFSFCASHQLVGHPKCGRMHGHNYIVIIEAESLGLDYGMVIDFGNLKSIVRPIIDELDHKYLCAKENGPMLREEEIFFLDEPRSTAECLAHYLYCKISDALTTLYSSDVYLRKVIVKETPTNFASFRRAI